MQVKEKSNSFQIAKCNDELRSQLPYLPAPHCFVLTDEVAKLEQDVLLQLFEKIRLFSNFTEDNDPWMEHDFGTIEVGNEKYFWKFDYFDEDFLYHKEDGIRVLTLLHSSEY